MAKARKTIEVEVVVRMANAVMDSPTSSRESRLTAASMAAQVLMQTGNYKGFKYLASECLPAEEQTDDNVLRPDFDGTRRHYFYSV